ncbi:hypothetical protein XarbCFBP8150_21305, partial [Xanthomonas arboricola]
LRPQGSFAQTVAWTLQAQPPPAAATLQGAHRCIRRLCTQQQYRRIDCIERIATALHADQQFLCARLQRAEAAGYRNAGYLRQSPLLQPLRTL